MDRPRPFTSGLKYYATAFRAPDCQKVGVGCTLEAHGSLELPGFSG